MVDQLGLANEWFVRLAEPVRFRERRSHFDPALTRSTFTSFEFLRGWYRPLSEPVRAKRPLPTGARPTLFEIINHVEFRFALTEQGDTGAFTFTSYPPRNMAQVTITAIPTYSGGMTSNVISRKRRYY